jgi:hypothetical protein
MRVIGCALVGVGVISLILTHFVHHNLAPQAGWLGLVWIGVSSLCVALGALGILHDNAVTLATSPCLRCCGRLRRCRIGGSNEIPSRQREGTLPARKLRKWHWSKASHPPELHDAVNGRHRAMQMAARKIQAQAASARQRVAFAVEADVEVLASAFAHWAREPKPR